MFDHIILRPEQEELLCVLVEAERRIAPGRRDRFRIVRSQGGDSFLHWGLKKEESRLSYDDARVLGELRLLDWREGHREAPNFEVSGLGLRYYEWLKKQREQPAERVEHEVRRWLDGESCRAKYQNAYERWAAAESMLWSSDSEEQFTTIGHLCREAMQQFADVLVRFHNPPEVDSDIAHTKNRIVAVIRQRQAKLGETAPLLLEAMIAYWDALVAYVQRQEHGGAKEGEPIRWEDARRVVFQTASVMFEIDRALG